LLARELPECLYQFGPDLDALKRGLSADIQWRVDDQPKLTLSASATTPIIKREVDQDSTRVRKRHLHRTHSRPVPGEPQQTFLDQIFCLGLVPRDQVRHANEVVHVLADESIKRPIH
jgi:hypothetical protein